jgi:hypothetical protein
LFAEIPAAKRFQSPAPDITVPFVVIAQLGRQNYNVSGGTLALPNRRFPEVPKGGGIIAAT